MKSPLLVAALLALSAVQMPLASSDGATEAFAKLRSLVGDWEGPYRWNNSDRGGGQVSATYALTGHGSALVETLTMSDGTADSSTMNMSSASMSSVYHQDGKDLRVTHYCAAQNQPRLKASSIDLARGYLKFDFVDITNLVAPDAPYMNGLELQLIDANHLNITFSTVAHGQTSHEVINLTRRPRTRS